jgi:hypothetical protein
MGANVKLDFSCGGKVAGRFMDIASYPKTAGRYRYMPYRGPGHLLLQEQCHRSGFARCAYEGADGQVTFVVRTVAATGILDVEEIDEAP